MRCDRQDPCSQCTKQDVSCTFPISGRLPRYHRDSRTAASQPSVEQKHAGLLGRLRKLEAMVSDLSTQFEVAATGDESDSIMPEPSSISSASSGKITAKPSNATESGLEYSTRMGVDISALNTDSIVSPKLTMPPNIQDSAQNDDMVIRRDGDIVVGDRFWTVFCSEVGLSSFPPRLFALIPGK